MADPSPNISQAEKFLAVFVGQMPLNVQLAEVYWEKTPRTPTRG